MRKFLLITALLGAISLLLLIFFGKNRHFNTPAQQPPNTPSEPTNFRFFIEEKLLNESTFETLVLPVNATSVSPTDSILISFPTYLRQQSSFKNSGTVFMIVSDRLNDSAWISTLEQSVKAAIIQNKLLENSPTVVIANTRELTAETLPQIKARLTTILREIHSDYEVKNWIIGLSDSHSCSSLSTSAVQAFTRTDPVSSVLIYDGCFGDIVTPETFQLPSGVNILLGSYVNANGVGARQPTSLTTALTNAEYLTYTWRLGTSLSNSATACVQKEEKVTLLERPSANQRRQNRKVLGMTLSQDNATNVRAMTNIAFCALYANNR